MESSFSWRAKRFDEYLLPGACLYNLDRFKHRNVRADFQNLLRLFQILIQRSNGSMQNLFRAKLVLRQGCAAQYESSAFPPK